MTAPGKALAVIQPEVLRVRELLEQRRRERDDARAQVKLRDDVLNDITRSRDRFFLVGCMVIVIMLVGVIYGVDVAIDRLNDQSRTIEALQRENAEQDHVIRGMGERIDGLAARIPTI